MAKANVRNAHSTEVIYGLFRHPGYPFGWTQLLLQLLDRHLVLRGIMAGDVGVETISYRCAMEGPIALWMAMAPLIAAMGRRRWRRR